MVGLAQPESIVEVQDAIAGRNETASDLVISVQAVTFEIAKSAVMVRRHVLVAMGGIAAGVVAVESTVRWAIVVTTEIGFVDLIAGGVLESRRS